MEFAPDDYRGHDSQTDQFLFDVKGHEIYKNETYYLWDDKPLCLECFSDEIIRLLTISPELVAEMIGVKVMGEHNA